MSNNAERAKIVGERRLLRCNHCGHSFVCAITEALGYTRTGWPRCCNTVMTLFAEVQPPAADDTALDKPALPPDGPHPA